MSAWADPTLLIVSVAGAIDSVTAPQLRDGIALAMAAKPVKLVLDLTGTGFLSSAGVNELVQLAYAARDDTILLHLAASTAVRRPLEALGLVPEVLTVYASVADAVAAFGDHS